MKSVIGVRHALAIVVLALAVGPAGVSTRGQAPGPPAAAAADPQARLQGFERHQALKQASPFKDLSWQFLGPTNISGRVTDVAVVAPRGASYTVYAATATGGLWKTDNDGVTWAPVFDQAATTSIGDVTIAPSNPEIIWVGTGEANIFRSSNAGAGVYRSVDGGRTWQHRGLASTLTIARIVIHPSNPDTVYVAASGHEWTDNEERGVFKTADGGATWKKVLYVSPRTGAIDLAMDPSNPGILYASTWQRIRRKWNDPRNEPGYGESGIYKSTDGGETWAPINAGLPPAASRGRIGIDVSRSRPSTLYAFVDNYEIARKAKPGERDAYGRQRADVIKGAEVYRSDDAGATWRKVSESNAYMERLAGTYGWVFGQIRVDPADENVVYVLGLALNVSRDGGKTFQAVGDMHGDHHALWIDPANPKFLVNGNDGGVVFSYDQGKTWRAFLDNLPAVQFFNVSYDMDTPFHVYGSIQDHGSRRAAVDISQGRDRVRPQAFQSAPGGEGSRHAIDPRNPNLVYSASFYHNINRTDLSKTDARGRPQATGITPRVSPADGYLRGQWLSPILLSIHNPDVVYFGGQYLFRSWNRGESWEKLSGDLSYNDPKQLGDIPYQTVFALAESPMRFGLLYAGTDDGRLHVTRDGGRTWAEITKGLQPRRWVSKAVASAFDEGTVYVTQNGKRDDDVTAYVWKSTDFGATWKSIVANIPMGPVNVIAEDPADARILYVGTDIGVYVTIDGGTTWNVLGGNLPSTYVHDIVIHPRDRMIVAATHGRGLWVMDAVPVQAAA
ncbi:MAG: VPS10 domain-containing protein, partial [Rhodospirillaceae bacterium]